jgi:hypothetical protein
VLLRPDVGRLSKNPAEVRALFRNAILLSYWTQSWGGEPTARSVGVGEKL